MTFRAPYIVAVRAPFPGAAGESELTVVILTRNEAARLPRCVTAVPPCYPVLVIDSGSTDGTAGVARGLQCAVVVNPWPGFAAQRNFALSNCGIASPWTLFIDADEIFPEAFFRWFEESFDRGAADAVWISSRLAFEGRELRFAPGYPIWHARLVRTSALRFVANHSGHGETVPQGARTIRIDIPYRHEFYQGDITGWFTKHLSLADAEAGAGTTDGSALSSRGRISRRLSPTLLRAPLRFLYHYVIRGGFRDGRAGYEYASMYAWYELTKYLIGRARRD